MYHHVLMSSCPHVLIHHTIYHHPSYYHSCTHYVLILGLMYSLGGAIYHHVSYYHLGSHLLYIPSSSQHVAPIIKGG